MAPLGTFANSFFYCEPLKRVRKFNEKLANFRFFLQFSMALLMALLVAPNGITWHLSAPLGNSSQWCPKVPRKIVYLANIEIKYYDRPNIFATD